MKRKAGKRGAQVFPPSSFSLMLFNLKLVRTGMQDGEGDLISAFCGVHTTVA